MNDNVLWNYIPLLGIWGGSHPEAEGEGEAVVAEGLPQNLAVNQLTGTNQQIVQSAMQNAGNQAPTWEGDLISLANATQQYVPAGQVTNLGQFQGSMVMGSVTSGVGIVDINGVNSVVQKTGPTTFQVIGRFR